MGLCHAGSLCDISKGGQSEHAHFIQRAALQLGRLFRSSVTQYVVLTVVIRALGSMGLFELHLRQLLTICAMQVAWVTPASEASLSMPSSCRGRVWS